MPTKRALEKRLSTIERRRDRRDPERFELTEEEEARIEAQIQSIYASLDPEQRAEIERIKEEAPDDPAAAEEGPGGLTDATAAMFDILTGGRP